MTNLLSAAIELIPALIDIIKDAIENSGGNDEVAKAYLLGIIGATPENKIRVQIALLKAKAEQELK